MYGNERVSLLEIALILILVVVVTAFGLVWLNGAFGALGSAIPTSIGGNIVGSVGN
jgi:hypothetical protein